MNNILVLLVDCLRADRVFGDSKKGKTPHLDNLQAEGTSFTQAIAQASFTSSAVGSILTGTYSFTHGIRSLRGYKLNPSVATLPEILQAHGYYTQAEVTGPLLPEMGLDKGFFTYNYRNVEKNFFTPWGDALLRELANGTLPQPWFLFVHFWMLHEQVGRERVVPSEFDRPQYGRGQYDRSVSAFDYRLGQLLETLDEKTIVVLLSDHGEQIYETLWDKWAKQMRRYYLALMRRLGRTQKYFLEIGHGYHVYDYLVRIPLIFKGPGFPSGKVVPQQVRQVDVMPTLLDNLGISPEYDYPVPGADLRKMIYRGEADDRPAYMEACDDVFPDQSKWLAGIRLPPYKYVYGPYNEEIQPELYNVIEDPHEGRNLVNQDGQIAKRLRAELMSIREEDQGEMSLRGNRMTQEEEAKVAQRLKELGYM